MFGFRLGAATDVGVQRQVNQDSYGTAAGLAVVADGMGGHRGGEVASTLAIQEVVAKFASPDIESLVNAVEQANRRILDEAAANTALHNMGTTVVALGLVEVDGSMALGAVNVGDSRMYRLTGPTLEQVTEDHSLVEVLLREGRITAEEAVVHPQRNIVTRALGVIDQVEVDAFHFVPQLGDRYLLCSDGLFNEVDAKAITEIMTRETDPQTAAEQLIEAANASGGRDNITTVVADIVETEHAAMPQTPSFLASPAQSGESGESIGVGEPGAAVFDQPDHPTPPAAKRSRWPWRR